MAAGDGAGAMIDHCFLTSTLLAYFPFFVRPFALRLRCFFSGYPSPASRFPLSAFRSPLRGCAFFSPPLTRPPRARLFVPLRLFLKRKRIRAFPKGSNEFFRR